MQLERAVWQTASNLLLSPSSVRELIETRRREFAGDGVGSELKDIRHAMESTDHERSRRLGQHAKGYITDTELDLALRSLTERKERYQEEIKRLESEARISSHIIESLDHFMGVANHVKGRLGEMNEEERAEVMELLIDSVVVEPDGVRIVVMLDGATQESAATS